MKNIKRLMTAFLAMVLLFSGAGGVLMAAAEETVPEKWEENVLVQEPFAVFGVEPKVIKSVTFLDSMDEVPEIAWNMGKTNVESVKAWFQWEADGGHVFFAADGGINGKDCAKSLFEDMENLTEVNFNGAFHTEQVEYMTAMFYNCKNLEKVDVSTLNTQSAECFYRMFKNCRKLTELDLSGFDTAKVTNMSQMFFGCKNLKTVNVAGWNTEKVTTMETMFLGCQNLEEPDFTGWNVESVQHWYGFLDSGKTVNGEAWRKLFQ